MWNHFDKEFERTNSGVEGDSESMGLNCGASHPDINKAFALLRNYVVKNAIKYENAKKPNARAINNLIRLIKIEILEKLARFILACLVEAQ